MYKEARKSEIDFSRLLCSSFIAVLTGSFDTAELTASHIQHSMQNDQANSTSPAMVHVQDAWRKHVIMKQVYSKRSTRPSLAQYWLLH